mmetsp:Transcript_58709/g.136993  ORF Transcript_58709/g.136993 Transcript_58709/m.136993 type:complete len:233 (-) Transcript_58709:175-873(-)
MEDAPPTAAASPAAGQPTESEGWTLYTDPTTGYPYYHNAQLGKSMWAHEAAQQNQQQQSQPQQEQPSQPQPVPQDPSTQMAVVPFGQAAPPVDPAQRIAAAPQESYGVVLVQQPQVALSAEQQQYIMAWQQQQQQALYLQYAAAAAAQQAAAGATVVAAVAGTNGQPSTGWITNRLIDREKARIEKNYSEADRLRAQLREQGVEVDDRLRTWSCKDGRKGHRPNHNDPAETE